MAKNRNRKFGRSAQQLDWAEDLAGDNEIPALIHEGQILLNRRAADASRLKEIRDSLRLKLGSRKRARGPGWQLFWFAADEYPGGPTIGFKVRYANWRVPGDAAPTGEILDEDGLAPKELGRLDLSGWLRKDCERG